MLVITCGLLGKLQDCRVVDQISRWVANPARRVLRLIERTIVDLGFCHKHGNALLLPAYELEGWTTTLPQKFTMQDIIDLYKDHATHEQFHSEFKTDMDLERLPSGKFDTNLPGLRLGGGGDEHLASDWPECTHRQRCATAPLRHAAKRRRMKTVMQEIMFKAGRMIKHAGRWVLGLGANDRSSTRRQRLRHPRSPEVTALKRIAAVFSPKVALLRGFTPPAITVRRSPGHQPVHQFARGGGLVLAH